MGWLSGWSKRKELVLTGGASGALVDFQLNIDVAYAAAMQSDFDCLRFTQADGTTLIDAWLESKVDSTSAETWAEFPTTPANTVEQTYYMYYGKEVANYWDIGATFIFGDDFDGDLSKWTTAGSPAVSGGKVTLSQDDKIRSLNQYGQNVVTRIDFQRLSAAESYGRIGMSNSILSASFAADDAAFRFTYDDYEDFHSLNEGSDTDSANDGTYDTKKTLEIQRIGTIPTFVLDGDAASPWTPASNIPDEAMNIRIEQGTTSSDLYIYLVFVRKYAANPPTYAFGAEESAPIGAAPMGVFTGCFGRPLGGII